MRGERQPISSLKLLFFGSSPHARGTLNSVVDPLLIPRFIPACAGNAFTPAVHQKFVTVHPRMRGERLAALPCAGIFTGSSPHARGTHPGMGVSQLQDRFIPACAGNADERKMTLEGSPVHPRMRGERVPFLAAMRSNTGSSPHARGTRRTLSARRSTMRFIPACAGNALVPSAWDSITAVHPRMRGERDKRAIDLIESGGSSPHARGTPIIEPISGRHIRFIPACAGNASDDPSLPSRESVHPRMRGERVAQIRSQQTAGGSSPHARGTRTLCRGRLFGWRFIPACAGNAGFRPSGPDGHAVHPRMRGERNQRCATPTTASGSSPHARGTPASSPSSSRTYRFIPACAGNAHGEHVQSSQQPVHPRMRGERHGPKT